MPGFVVTGDTRREAGLTRDIHLPWRLWRVPVLCPGLGENTTGPPREPSHEEGRETLYSVGCGVIPEELISSQGSWKASLRKWHACYIVDCQFCWGKFRLRSEG